GPEVAADEHGVRKRGETAGALEDLAGRRPELDLGGRPRADGAEGGDEHRPGLVRRPALPEPRRSVARDEPDVRERLDVLYEHAVLVRPFHRRLRRPAVQEVE